VLGNTLAEQGARTQDLPRFGTLIEVKPLLLLVCFVLSRLQGLAGGESRSDLKYDSRAEQSFGV
jgi:hypothetical protein